MPRVCRAFFERVSSPVLLARGQINERGSALADHKIRLIGSGARYFRGRRELCSGIPYVDCPGGRASWTELILNVGGSTQAEQEYDSLSAGVSSDARANVSIFRIGRPLHRRYPRVEARRNSLDFVEYIYVRIGFVNSISRSSL